MRPQRRLQPQFRAHGPTSQCSDFALIELATDLSVTGGSLEELKESSEWASPLAVGLLGRRQVQSEATDRYPSGTNGDSSLWMHCRARALHNHW